MAEFQRYQRSEMVTPAGVSNAKAQSFKSLASRLQSFSGQMQNQADQEYQSQIDAYSADLENDIIESVGRLSIDNSTNFNKFGALVNERKKVTLEGIDDPTLKQRAALFFDKKIVQYGEKVWRTTFQLQQQEKQQQAINDIRIHESDTQSMITSAIRNAYESNVDENIFIKEVGPIVQGQRAYIANKFENMPALATKAGQGKKATKERSFLVNLYKTAVWEEAMIQEEAGGSGVNILFEFDKNPSEFFNSRSHLNALFPESKIQLTEQEQTAILIDGAKKLNAYRDNQERLDDQKTKLKEVEWAKQHTFILDQIVTNPGLITTDMVIQSYNDGDLGKDEHDSLLKILQSDGLFKDDEALIYDLNIKLDDPSYDKEDLYKEILEGTQNQQISVTTQRQMLSDLRSESRSNTTGSWAYTTAMKEADSEFTPTGFLATLNPKDAALINNLKREIRAISTNPDIQSEEDFIEAWDIVKARYKRSEQVVDTIVTWNPNWVGSSDSPNVEETQRKLAKQLEVNQISEREYLDQFEQIEKYNSSLILRKSRQ